jgi:hypothetical protein
MGMKLGFKDAGTSKKHDKENKSNASSLHTEIDVQSNHDNDDDFESEDQESAALLLLKK